MAHATTSRTRVRRSSRIRRPPGGSRPTSVADAWGVLSPRAFAVWIRLHTLPVDLLEQGGAAVARELAYPERSFNRVLHELRARGFIHLFRTAGGGRLHVLLARNAMLVETTRFLSDLVSAAGVRDRGT